MNRPLQYINLIGVLLLAGLCVFQWKQDRRLNLQVNQLEKKRQDLETKTQDLDKKLKAASEDNEYFRAQIAKNAELLRATEQKLDGSEVENLHLTSERDQLKTAVTNWAAAVEARDEQVRKLANELNNSVEKFNQLATNHNAMVREFEARAAAATAAATNAATAEKK